MTDFNLNDEIEREKQMTREIEKQKVWRTYSATEGCGFFVWEILEVMYDTYKIIPTKHFKKCRDGSYIMIGCYHFWTSEKATVMLNDAAMDEYQTVEVIEKPESKKYPYCTIHGIQPHDSMDNCNWIEAHSG